ncbi:GTPase [Methylomonas rhizoryzae]|uniref:GTPase n=1 Tax=Methylomonas rhizoryzae TaxID=2608981 RepID=UPI0012325BAE|nr:GTPase [Methylomonas rhizoryzae]
MACAYSELLSRAQAWADSAVSAGQLPRARAQSLAQQAEQLPDSLFSCLGSATERPLVVAFLGGTGVGKSSLLNRMVGYEIAKAGVERPTSREVTLYHHHTFSLQRLPGDLPLASVKISQHNDDRNAAVVWLDMPDFDSIELGNKRLVLQWLPHIDVLIYVVSPERYRDNKAWQLLLAEGAKHAWLFVMNQWDRGQTVQFDDFRRQLQIAGFQQPLLYRTSCLQPETDQFGELLLQLHELAGRRTIDQLAKRNEAIRIGHLGHYLRQLLSDFERRDYQGLLNSLDDVWQPCQRDLLDGLAWPAQQLANFWAAHPGQKADIRLWDEWAQSRLSDALDELVLQAVQTGIPGKSLKDALQPIRDHAGKSLGAHAEVTGRQALLNPGGGLRRGVLKFILFAEAALPLSALSWVGYQVFSQYYQGVVNGSGYLGLDFAVHSVLLIGISWLLPFFLHKKLQPSLNRAGFRGLQKGMALALAAVAAELKQVIASEREAYTVSRRQLSDLIESCTASAVIDTEQSGLLARALPESGDRVV